MRWIGPVAALAFSIGGAFATEPVQTGFPADVQKLLGQLTLDEKISLTTGSRDPAYHGQSGYTPGVPRLGIPPLRWGNGPSGLENAYETTAVPPPNAVAATFNPQLARRLGDLIGLEGRFTGIDVINGPDVGVVRMPNGGGGGYGEDPYLCSRIAEQVVLGIQAHDVMATAKHYIAYAQALHAGAAGAESYDFRIDDRTLHEIYLPPFEAALKAGASSVMAAYSKVNGEYNPQNETTLNGILRDELGWDGWVNSDWHATRSIAAITKGQDVEMPGYGVDALHEDPRWGDKMKAAIQRGEVPQASLDRAVGRVLAQMKRVGMLDGRREPAAPLDVAGDAAIAREIATQGAVLLKNDGILPLATEALANLVLIGPTAAQLAVGSGGNRAFGIAGRKVAPLDALRTTAGSSAHIAYAVGARFSGVAVPASALTPEGRPGAGLARKSEDGAPVVVDATIDFVGQRALPMGRSFTWSAVLKPPEDGVYVLQAQSWGGETVLRIDGRQVATSSRIPFGHGVPRQWTSLLPTTDDLDNGQATMQLQADRTYRVELQARGDALSPLQVRFAWITPQMRRQDNAAAVAAAKSASVAVVFAWAGAGGAQAVDEQGAALPAGQNELIEAVAAANPNTIVVLNTGAGVSMPWRARVKAILQMWYPGQEGGWATADLLLGRANPSGKLPVTVPVKLTDTGPLQPGHPERYEGNPATKEVVFSEGVMVGYRWFDRQRIEPLFPFGYGLSYTNFAYSALKLRRAGDGVDVTFTVSNSGRVRGAEVAQVYLGPAARSPVELPPKALAAFLRIDLAPGESRTVTARVSGRQLSYWDSARKAWRIVDGRRPVYVGASSRDIRLNGALAIGAR